MSLMVGVDTFSLLQNLLSSQDNFLISLLASYVDYIPVMISRDHDLSLGLWTMEDEALEEE